MKRTALALSLILAILISVVATIGNVKFTSASSDNWVEVTRYSGELSGLGYPRKFTVNHSEWRVNWKVIKRDTEWNYFQLILSDQAISASRDNVIGKAGMTNSEPTSGTLIMHSQNRTFQILVEVCFVKSWEVIIEENVNSPLLDIIDPTVSIISPENKTYHSETVELSYIVNEPTSSLWYQLDQGSDTSLFRNKTRIEVSLGEHNLIVYAKDEAGNIGFSETIYFGVEESLPTTWIVVAVMIVVIVAVVGLGLLIYLIKRK